MIGGCAPEPPVKGLAALCKPALRFRFPNFATALAGREIQLTLTQRYLMLASVDFLSL